MFTLAKFKYIVPLQYLPLDLLNTSDATCEKMKPFRLVDEEGVFKC